MSNERQTKIIDAHKTADPPTVDLSEIDDAHVADALVSDRIFGTFAQGALGQLCAAKTASEIVALLSDYHIRQIKEHLAEERDLAARQHALDKRKY